MTATTIDHDPVSLRSARAIELARWATVVTACSVMVSPPLANAAMAVMRSLGRGGADDATYVATNDTANSYQALVAQAADALESVFVPVGDDPDRDASRLNRVRQNAHFV